MCGEQCIEARYTTASAYIKSPRLAVDEKEKDVVSSRLKAFRDVRASIESSIYSSPDSNGPIRW